MSEYEAIKLACHKFSGLATSVCPWSSLGGDTTNLTTLGVEGELGHTVPVLTKSHLNYCYREHPYNHLSSASQAPHRLLMVAVEACYAICLLQGRVRVTPFLKREHLRLVSLLQWREQRATLRTIAIRISSGLIPAGKLSLETDLDIPSDKVSETVCISIRDWFCFIWRRFVQ